MTVLSPNTSTTNRAGCLNTASRSQAQTITPIPPAIYVSPTTTSPCAGVGYPLTLTGPTRTESTLGATPDHSCSNGTAYVSGRLQGRTTVGANSDVVVTGDLTYTGGVGTTSTDVLGLIANNYVWVYHPVSHNGSTTCTPQPSCRGDNMLAGTAEVHKIQAAILSVNHSFLVQSWEYGAALNYNGQKLDVTGSISQKFRGPVGTSVPTGYQKNYTYDARLLNIPPPFFLQPKQAPWYVKEVSG